MASMGLRTWIFKVEGLGFRAEASRIKIIYCVARVTFTSVTSAVFDFFSDRCFCHVCQSFNFFADRCFCQVSQSF